jgi:hypothetical protein
MRRICVLAAAACLAAKLALSTTPIGAADEFPYTAYVVRDEAEVFAGPGHKYYATDRLPEGAAIEIYARDAATGFLAIRPLEQSFSWVPAEHVRVDSDDAKVGEVVVPTHSWIGTEVEHIREHKFQVRLPVGELLQIIGERQIQTGDGQPQTWLKITPPAGEFRWIPPKSVSRKPVSEVSDVTPDEEAADADAKIDLAAVKMPRRGGEKDLDEEDEQSEVIAAVAETRVPVKSGRPAAPAIALKDMRADGEEADSSNVVKQVQYVPSTAGIVSKPKTTGDGFVPRKPRKLEGGSTVPSFGPSPGSSAGPSPVKSSASGSRSGASVRADDRIALVDVKSANHSPGAPVISKNGTIASAAVRQELDAIDLDLSLMLSRPKENWNLGPLKSRVQELVDKGETAADRGEARLMHEKLDQIGQTFNVTDELVGVTAASGIAAVSKEASDPRYDGQGWLKPVLSRSRHAAPYALVDSEGKPTCFVTPSTGFKIERYVNKRVGIYGRRGVIESLNAQHVVAERVIDLEKQLR